MANRGRGSSKFVFIDEEEGELPDSDEDEMIDKKTKAQRDADFISEWSKKVQERKESEALANKSMEIGADDESESTIETLAISVVIRDRYFARDYLPRIASKFTEMFGNDSVRFDNNGLCVYLKKARQDSSEENSCNNETKLLTVDNVDNKGAQEESQDSSQRQSVQQCSTEAKMCESQDSGYTSLESCVPEVPSSITEKLNNTSGKNKKSTSSITEQSNLAVQPLATNSSNHDESMHVSTCADNLNELNSTDLPNDKFQSNDPSGMESMAVIFHDKNVYDNHFDFVKEFCESLFGSGKVTSDLGIIEICKDELFEVDTTRYGKMENVRYTIPDDGLFVEEGKPKKSFRPGPGCFNCGGPHSLGECTERRNYETINANREQFRQNKLRMNMRYHAEREKYSGLLAPGLISPKLREALGLSEKQLPRHIYLMRKHGYPPGWLREARVAHSGVAVYGKAGTVPEDGEEDGQVFEDGEKDKYDIKKLIEFPGFNAAAQPDVKDEHEKFICPAYSDEMDIGHMIERLAPNAYQAYKRRKMNAEVDSDQPNDVNNETSHEILSTPKRKEPSSLSRCTPTSISPGTPILPSASPFTSLPPREKFGHNISDVINFENLPNATGTYEKVSSSIAKVREYVRNYQ